MKDFDLTRQTGNGLIVQAECVLPSPEIVCGVKIALLLLWAAREKFAQCTIIYQNCYWTIGKHDY